MHINFYKRIEVYLLALIIINCFAFHTACANDDLIFAQRYIREHKRIAVEEMHRSKVPASIKLAQALLETDKGRSKLANEGNNHFGIKCKSYWTGETIQITDDAPDECFRRYPSVYHSYIDHSHFLQYHRNGHYSHLFDLNPHDYEAWAKGLRKAGYATNPRYANILIDLIHRYDLTRFDYMSVADIDIEIAQEEAIAANSKPIIVDGVLTYIPNPTPKPAPPATPVEPAAQPIAAVPMPAPATPTAVGPPTLSTQPTTIYPSSTGSTPTSTATSTSTAITNNTSIADNSGGVNSQPNRPLKPTTTNDVNTLAENNAEINGNAEEEKANARNNKQNIAEPIMLKEVYINGRKAVTSNKQLFASYISHNYNIPVGKLYQYNDARPGQKFKSHLPVFLENKKCKGEEFTHKVKADETMHDIAQQYGIKLKALYKRNRMKDGMQPQVNETISLKKKARKRPNIL